MGQIITIDKVELEKRTTTAKEWLKDRYYDASDWVSRNKEMALILAPIVTTAVTATIKGAFKGHNRRKEKELKEYYCYDRSLGHYWRLRRELSNAEWLAIDKRKQNGERLADILEELRVLK